MIEPQRDTARTPDVGRRTAQPRYPANHVVGIFATTEQLGAAVSALVDAGFAASEAEVQCGPLAADALHTSTGRKGLAHLAIRIAERIGIADDERMVKSRYEQALRGGEYVLLVPAESQEARARAAQVLRDHRAHFINFLGRFAIERLHP